MRVKEKIESEEYHASDRKIAKDEVKTRDKGRSRKKRINPIVKSEKLICIRSKKYSAKNEEEREKKIT